MGVFGMKEKEKKKVFRMRNFKVLVSTRLWIIVFVVLGIIFLWPQVGDFARGLEVHFLLFQFIICSVATAVTAFSAFEIESKGEFVKDIVMDVLLLLVPVVTLTRAFDTESYWFPFVVLGFSILFAAADFLISLNTGSGKLLEMDKQRFAESRD